MSAPSAAQMREESERFNFEVSKANHVFNNPQVLMSILYLAIMGVSLNYRNSTMGWIKPAGGPPLPDKWSTSDPASIFIMILSFTLVILVNLDLTSKILLKQLPQVPRMAPVYAWYTPFTLWIISTTYFIIFVNLSRYDVAWFEWLSAGVASFILMVASVHLYMSPVKQTDLVVMTA